MSSTDELLREVEDNEPSQPKQETESRRSRLTDKATTLFSPKNFVIALVLISIALYVTGSLIPIISAIPGTGFIGVFVAAFALGAINSERSYLETGVAGAVVSGVSVFSKFLVLTIAGRFGIELALIGGAVGAVVALLGYYFGRDLRTGVTKDIE
jgi:FtsH-binding integral membrane protein